MSALPARWRYRVAPAMRKEFFDATFSRPQLYQQPELLSVLAVSSTRFRFRSTSPARSATLRYMGDLANDGWCVLIFPEGKMTNAGEIAPFQPGVGMIASKLGIPVVPIRLEGLDHVLHKTGNGAHGPRTGRVRRAASSQRQRLPRVGKARRGSRSSAANLRSEQQQIQAERHSHRFGPAAIAWAGKSNAGHLERRQRRDRPWWRRGADRRA